MRGALFALLLLAACGPADDGRWPSLLPAGELMPAAAAPPGAPPAVLPALEARAAALRARAAGLRGPVIGAGDLPAAPPAGPARVARTPASG